jgi:hypothetical protein
MVIELRSSKKHCHNQLTSHNSNTCSYVIHHNLLDSFLVLSSVKLRYVQHFHFSKSNEADNIIQIINIIF